MCRWLKPFIPLLLLLLLPSALCAHTKYTVTDHVWFRVELQHEDSEPEPLGTFTVGVFGLTAPMTAMNFVTIAEGNFILENKFKLHYKNSPVHRIVPDFIIQMGDITVGDGTGGASIYGTRYNDEPFVLSHRAPGWIAMANHGPDTNGSQFYVLLQKARWLDGKHVVFGKIVKGFDVIKKIGEIETNPQTAVPKKKVTVVDCGVHKLEKPYTLNEEELDDTRDL